MVGLGQGALHSAGGLALHVGQHMAVSVQCDGDGGVAQQFLHDLRMETLRQQKGGAGVPEVVKAHPTR